MVRRPLREVSFPLGLLGVGVVDRGGSSKDPADRVAVEPFLDNFPNPFNMASWSDTRRWVYGGRNESGGDFNP